MNAATSVAGFAVVLAAVFAGSAGVGAALGPDESVAAAPGHGADHGDDGEGDGAHGAPPEGSSSDARLPGGLMVSQDGYTLALADTSLAAGSDVPLRFTVTGPDGEPVTAYDVEHEKELHLIAVRRDFAGFQHVHPTRADDGTWATELDLTPGSWRVFADFAAAGADALTLGADLSVPGDAEAPQAPGDEVRTAVVDGYTVTLDGELSDGSSRLTLSVARGGEPVTDLQPYLGAYGHLVALRAGDLAYLHVHPDGEPGSVAPGPEVVFHAEVPSDGTYHLFLDFKHDGVVRTAAFVVGTESDDHAH